MEMERKERPPPIIQRTYLPGIEKSNPHADRTCKAYIQLLQYLGKLKCNPSLNKFGPDRFCLASARAAKRGTRSRLKVGKVTC
jgi:hypothetical protein